jgi:tetracycline 7-halogenase / FADH2 O2-dependent halogenase
MTLARTSERGTATPYDVAVLGAGIAGSVLAAVLARGGVKVLLVDAGTHPRFAVGESTIPHTTLLLRVISERYGVPEVAHLAGFANVRRHVSPACGVKRNFGFVYQREGRAQNPAETNQFVIPKVMGAENHLFRQDVDAYVFHAAVRYGATPRQNTRITEVDIDGSGVTLASDRGETFRARYVVDASGFRSPLAEKFGLREQPTRLRHHSRSLFTHMVGVRPYDACMTPRAAYRNPVPWHEGTLHHVFDGGWLWVIPFGNHPGSTNELCSVGLTLDPRVHPRPDGPPEREFAAFLDKYPDIAPQFTAATAVRDWVSTPRMQYSTTRTVGDRFCVTAHAAGFVDALYSRGLTNTLEVVNALGHRLIAACRDGDFSRERFAYVEQLEQGLLDANDAVVHCSFTGFRDYELWNAAFHLWALFTLVASLPLQDALNRFREGDAHAFDALETMKNPGAPLPMGDDGRRLLDDSVAVCEEVREGRLRPREAADRIFALIRAAEFSPPAMEFGNPARKILAPGPGSMLKMLRWSRTSAPPELGPLFRGPAAAVAREKTAWLR